MKSVWYLLTVIMLAFIACIWVSSCDVNVTADDYVYTKAYASWPGGVEKVIEIERWNFINTNLVHIVGKDGKTYILHSMNVVLVKE